MESACKKTLFWVGSEPPVGPESNNCTWGGEGMPAQKVHFWLGRQFLTKMCPNQVFFDALSNGNIRK